MTIIIFAYLALCIAVCMFRRYISFILVVGNIAAWYMVCYGHRVGAGLLLFAVLVFAGVLLDVANGVEESDEGRKALKTVKEKRREASRKTDGSSRWIFYAIPIFWPFLIAWLVLGGKTAKTDMTPYDYEQHLKSNR